MKKTFQHQGTPSAAPRAPSGPWRFWHLWRAGEPELACDPDQCLSLWIEVGPSPRAKQKKNFLQWWQQER